MLLHPFHNAILIARENSCASQIKQLITDAVFHPFIHKFGSAAIAEAAAVAHGFAVLVDHPHAVALRCDAYANDAFLRKMRRNVPQREACFLPDFVHVFFIHVLPGANRSQLEIFLVNHVAADIHHHRFDARGARINTNDIFLHHLILA